MNKKIIIASASLGLLLIIYLGFTIYFSSHYFWNTIIGSVECGGKTSSYVIEQNETEKLERKISIKERLAKRKERVSIPKETRNKEAKKKQEHNL